MSSASLGRVYEEHILSTGSLDERIFTGDGANEDIGSSGHCLCEGIENQGSSAYRIHSNLNVSKHIDMCTYGIMLQEELLEH